MKKISILSASTIIFSSILFILTSEGKAQKSNNDKFLTSNSRGIVYLFPKEFKNGGYISNTKDTADYRIGKHLIQEYKYKIFLNNKFIGKVLEGDTVVLNKGKVTIRKSYWENNSGIGSGITYFFPKNMTVKSRGFYNDTVTWLLDDFCIKEYRNEIFLNGSFIGTANSRDTVIFKKGSLSIRKAL